MLTPTPNAIAFSICLGCVFLNISSSLPVGSPFDKHRVMPDLSCMILLISLFDGPQCDSIRKISISRIQWQILCSLNISGKKVLTRGSMPSDD